MKPQHTPGPWQYRKEFYRNGEYRSEGFGISCNDQAIAEMIDDEADARLIAAAPEMLEALKHASKYLVLQKENGPIAYVINKAIARAEGKD